MTRAEEHMRVGVERHEAGRARLRKYVVTEEAEQTVPLRHEEVRVEREPITEANRTSAMAGPDIAEAEYEVTLHEERPVVRTEVEPVERVRLVTEEHITQETVRGRVRKERIEGETERIGDDIGADIGTIDDRDRGRGRHR
jgi:stress response protein YsnF